MRTKWDEIRLPEDDEAAVWELFHENSKTTKYDDFLAGAQVEALSGQLIESLPYEQFPSVELPAATTPLPVSLDLALRRRATARALEAAPVSLQDLSTILHLAYGINRGSEETPFRRPLRMIPSAGALYPLELFFHSSHVTGLRAGIYHYNPVGHNLRLYRPEDKTAEIAAGLVQKTLAVTTSAVIFVSAKLEGATMKYGNRGYRFVLLEAGHLAQNVNLVANALGLGCVNIGGYSDRQIDDLLALDGLRHSTIYMIGIGREHEAAR
jgi:SagB-type dehydrogenase family enzyme